MKRPISSDSLQTVLIATLGACASAGALAQTAVYSPTELPNVPGRVSPQVVSANDAGRAVGFDTDAQGKQVPAFWQGTEPKELPQHLSTGVLLSDGQAEGINKFDQMVGGALDTDSKEHALKWDASGSRVTELVPPKGLVVPAEALAINDAGQSVGFASVPGSFSRAVLWNGQTPIQLPTPQGLSSEANSINAGGVVIGTLFADFRAIGARWEGSSLLQLNAFPGGSMSFGFAINDAGVMVGEANIVSPDGNQPLHAARWNGTNPNPVDLGSLLGVTGSSFAAAINNHGEIVGQSDAAGGSAHAVLWENNKIVDLNTVTKALPKGVVLNSASHIGDDGVIYASGVDEAANKVRAFRLNPHFATTTQLQASANPAHVGQSVTLTAKVIARGGHSAATGTVTFNDGKVKLGAATLNSFQQAKFVTKKLPVGSHAITAVYSGAANLLPSTSATLNERIQR